MEDKAIYLLLFVILFLILMVCLIFLLISNRKLFQRITTLQEINDNLSLLNDRLRMDRHDYLNQLQVVYGLMELKEYDEMNSYLKKVYNELLKTGKTIKTAKPAVNAMLAAKLSECESKGIDLIIEV
ncbi:MAG: Spo0B domain-containing protein, partial [Lachnospiraceae bacterium]|nr:Spo0B domain-containing protein [Lachnospiraceae bacterium]